MTAKQFLELMISAKDDPGTPNAHRPFYVLAGYMSPSTYARKIARRAKAVNRLREHHNG